MYEHYISYGGGKLGPRGHRVIGGRCTISIENETLDELWAQQLKHMRMLRVASNGNPTFIMPHLPVVVK